MSAPAITNIAFHKVQPLSSLIVLEGSTISLPKLMRPMN